MNYVSVRGTRLAYEARPEGFDPSALTTLFIHGSGGDRDDWRAQLDGLSDAVTVIALDLPGHGASDPPGESSVDAYSRWTIDFVESLGLREVFLVGCSLGSAIALWVALSPRPWLKAIGLVGSGARLKVHPGFLDGLKQNPPKALGMLTDFALSASTGEPVRGTVQAKFDNCSPDLVRADLSACNEFDVMEKLGEIAVPTWIIVGEDDRLTPAKYSSHLNSRIKGSRLVMVPAAGHLVMMEKPGEFNSHLREFLIELKK